MCCNDGRAVLCNKNAWISDHWIVVVKIDVADIFDHRSWKNWKMRSYFETDVTVAAGFIDMTIGQLNEREHEAQDPRTADVPFQVMRRSTYYEAGWIKCRRQRVGDHYCECCI